jgi:hypothetical protein
MTSFFLIVFGFLLETEETGDLGKDELLVKSIGPLDLTEEIELEAEGIEGLDDFLVLLLRFGIIY